MSEPRTPYDPEIGWLLTDKPLPWPPDDVLETYKAVLRREGYLAALAATERLRKAAEGAAEILNDERKGYVPLSTIRAAGKELRAALEELGDRGVAS